MHLHDDLELVSLCSNSVVVSRVPEEVIAIDEMDKGEFADDDDDSVEDHAFKNVQEMKTTEVATGALLSTNWCEAHLDTSPNTAQAQLLPNFLCKHHVLLLHESCGGFPVK